MSYNTITYHNARRNNTFTIPLGKDYEVKREDGDIILRCAPAVDLPLMIAIQIKADGSWRWWYTEAGPMLGNHYWHFANLVGDAPANRCADAQKETLNAIQSNRLDIFGVDAGLGNPVIKWAFGEQTASIAAAYHN